MWDDIKLANRAGPRIAFLPILGVPGRCEPREERSIMMTNQGSRTVLDSLLAKTHVQHALVQSAGGHNELPSVSAYIITALSGPRLTLLGSDYFVPLGWDTRRPPEDI